MRTNEERLAAMHRRAAKLEREKYKKQTFAAGTVTIAVCAVLIVFLAVLLPRSGAGISIGSAAPGLGGSIFASSGMLAYIVIAIVAFLLGVCITVFCFRLRKWRESMKNEDQR